MWFAIHIVFVGDFVGYVLAWSSMLPIFIFVGVTTLVLFRRDLHTVCIYIYKLLMHTLLPGWATLLKERPLSHKSGAKAALKSKKLEG